MVNERKMNNYINLFYFVKGFRIVTKTHSNYYSKMRNGVTLPHPPFLIFIVFDFFDFLFTINFLILGTSLNNKSINSL